MSLKIIKFTKNNIKKYRGSINKLYNANPVVRYSSPYVGMFDTKSKEVVSCIWIDKMNEISIATHREYQKQGLMTQLLEYITTDAYMNKLDELTATPISLKSKRLLRRSGFKLIRGSSCYEYSPE